MTRPTTDDLAFRLYNLAFAVPLTDRMWNWLAQNKEWVFSGVGLTVLAVGCWLVKRIFTRTSATSPINSVTQAPIINVAPVFNLPHTKSEKPKNESSAASTARPAEEALVGRPVLRSLPPRICFVTESEDGCGFAEGGEAYSRRQTT